VRYLTESFATGALRRGTSIEQFLGPVVVDGRRAIRWVTLSPADEGIVLREHAAEDVPGYELADLDELPPLYSDEDRAWGWVLGVAPDEPAALRLAQELAGAAEGRWVNVGVAGEDYLDYVKAGRPLA
jgi:hypothetical protein